MGTAISNSSQTVAALSDRRKFKELFDLGEKIGVGTYATVHKCFCKSGCGEFAVKTINKNYLTARELISLQNEIKILRNISHKNVIRLVDAFDDGKKVSIVLELCGNQDLLQQILSAQKKHFSERKSAQILHQLANGVKHLHDAGISHRDLKCENILFGNDGTVKITDFGLASAYSHKSKLKAQSILMHSCCGTPQYVAPEIITKNEYNYKCDIWSLGIILYILLVGYQPFKANSITLLYKEIINANYNVNSKEWINISSEAKDLVKCLLQVNPDKRYSTKDIFSHPWIIKHTNHNK